MKKESILASLLGVLCGVGVGLMILNTANRGDTKAVETARTTNKQPKAKPTSAVAVFTITEPSNDTAITGSTASIRGKGTKGSLVVVQSPSTGVVQKLQSDGFSIAVPVALGENVINVTYYPKDKPNDYVEKQIRVYKLPE